MTKFSKIIAAALVLVLSFALMAAGISPATGDESNLGLYVGILIVALAIIIVIVVFVVKKGKKSQDEDEEISGE